ncbi:MAG TPA: hypothetical protein DDY31_04805, partial [Lachnospiraceae bacterium]|nr:hypothetical protein [Lachnospiraceae bacterium]
MKEKEIQWHPPYIAAMNLELIDDRETFRFEPEYVLNTGALKIDLFMENRENKVVGNEIGKLFQKYNILEYKNPNDALDIDVFIKVQGYACLFKAYGEKSDCRKIESITVSLIRETRPDKLFRYFKEHNISVEIPYQGIYYVTGNIVPFRTQIVVTKELDWKKHSWLCSLSGKLTEQGLRELLAKVSRLEGKMEKEYADSILEVALKANRELAEKLRSDENMSKTLLEIMEPVLQERTEKAVKEGRKEG